MKLSSFRSREGSLQMVTPFGRHVIAAEFTKRLNQKAAQPASAFVMEEDVVAGHATILGEGRHQGPAREGGAPAFLSGVMPTASSSAGTTSTTYPTSCRSSPRAVMPRGQWTMNGVEMPPSCVQILCRRNGTLPALDQPGPRHR